MSRDRNDKMTDNYTDVMIYECAGFEFRDLQGICKNGLGT